MSTKAILVGINYNKCDPRYKLDCCINDVRLAEGFLTSTLKLDPHCITTLTDDESQHDDTKLPTSTNIVREIKAMLSESKRGDVCFIHFSCHGTQVLIFQYKYIVSKFF